MRVKRLSLIVALLSFAMLLVPSVFACEPGDGVPCDGVTITKEPLYSGYTYPDGTWVDSDPTSGLELYTLYEWYVQITIKNWNSYTITNVRLADRFGAEFAVQVLEYSGGSGGTAPVTWTKGNSAKVFLYWYIGSLGPGESAILVLHVWTDHNPAGKQEFTSYGTYDMNSGAVVKWLDDFGKQHSAETMPIEVSTIEEPYM